MKDKNYQLTVDALLRYQDAMYRIAMSTVRNADDALDIVQASALKALENYHKLKSPDSIRSWLFRIVVNEAIDHIKSSGRELLGEENIPESPYHEPAYDRSGEDVCEAVMKLPEQLGIPVILRYYEELSLREISEVTGINLSTVKTRLYKAHKLLGADLQEDYL